MATVLIVDDSPTEMHQLVGLLEKNGYTVLAAESGERGVTVAKSEQPNAILMDIILPGLNGFQATRQLNKAREAKHIPVVMVTAKDQETDKVWGMRPGAKAYLAKPVSENSLIDVVKEVIG
ncbi:MAG: twitching motility two-component system response regulator PilH [Porticoccus sp.]|jgi:twitching motility two-component system response regulator PilH